MRLGGSASRGSISRSLALPGNATRRLCLKRFYFSFPGSAWECDSEALPQEVLSFSISRSLALPGNATRRLCLKRFYFSFPGSAWECDSEALPQEVLFLVPWLCLGMRLGGSASRGFIIFHNSVDLVI
jgi:hypothetical protein